MLVFHKTMSIPCKYQTGIRDFKFPGYDGKDKWGEMDDGLIIQMPEKQSGEYAHVLAITI